MNRQKLDELREQAGLTGRGLAKKAGISQSEWQRMRHGSKDGPSFDSVCKVCRVLKISMDELADDWDEQASTGDDLAQRIADQTADKVSSRLQAFMADAGMIRLLDVLNLVPPEQHEDLRRCLASAIRRERESQES